MWTSLHRYLPVAARLNLDAYTTYTLQQPTSRLSFNLPFTSHLATGLFAPRSPIPTTTRSFNQGDLCTCCFWSTKFPCLTDILDPLIRLSSRRCFCDLLKQTVFIYFKIRKTHSTIYPWLGIGISLFSIGSVKFAGYYFLLSFTHRRT